MIANFSDTANWHYVVAVFTGAGTSPAAELFLDVGRGLVDGDGHRPRGGIGLLPGVERQAYQRGAGQEAVEHAHGGLGLERGRTEPHRDPPLEQGQGEHHDHHDHEQHEEEHDPREQAGASATESWSADDPTMAWATRPVAGGLEDLAHYLERDSTYGRLHAYLYGRRGRPAVADLDEEAGTMTVDGVPVQFLRRERNPADIDWRRHGVRLVVDTTGQGGLTITVDPTAEEVRLAESLLARYQQDEDRFPETVGMVWLASDIMRADG